MYQDRQKHGDINERNAWSFQRHNFRKFPNLKNEMENEREETYRPQMYKITADPHQGTL